jgi:hypothetical protein
VTWKKAHDDGPDHAWEDGAESALCGVCRDGDLLDGDDDRCFRCLMAHGTALADAGGDSTWRP